MAFGTVGSNIVFAIHSTGAGKLKANMAIAAAAIFAVGAALNSVRKSANEYSEIWRQLTPQLREAGIVADNAAKGLIDTTAVLRQMAVQEKAGITVTNEYATAMAKLATVEGQKLGKSAQEITADFEKLSEGIAKGSTRALKDYGIEIDNTEDLLLSQAEAMEKVIARAEDLTVEIRTLDEATYALGNQVDTFTGNLWNWVTSTDAADGTIVKMSESMGTMNTLIMETDGAIIDAAVNTLELRDAFALLGGPVTMAINWFSSLEDRINGAMKKSVELTRSIAGPISEFEFESTESDTRTSEMPEDMLSIVSSPGKTKDKDKDKPPKSGGGRRTPGQLGDQSGFAGFAAMTEQEKQLLDLEEALIIAMESGGILGAPDLMAGGGGTRFGMGELLDNAASMNDILGERLDIETELALVEADLAQVESDRRVEQWEAELAASEQEKLIQQEKHEWMLQNSEDYKNAQLRIAKAEAIGRMDFMGQMFGNISALMNTENRKLFAIGKAAALASAVVNTASAAVKAYEVGMGAGFPVGLVLGPAAAAAAVIAGSVQIATIAKTEFGSGAAGISNGAAGSPGGGSFGGGAFSGGIAQTPTGGGSDLRVINIQLGEATLWEVMIDMNDSASQSGSASFSRAS